MLQTKNMIDTMEWVPLTRSINFFISFNLVIRLMTSEYVTIGPWPWEAKIFLDHDYSEEIAEIKKGEDQKSFKLIRKNDGHKWTLTKKVHGEFRPFSISVLNQNEDNDINKVLISSNIEANSICLQIILRENIGMSTLAASDTYLG
jgi:hypothetical protein